jgi:hypothetical protein
LQFASRVPCFPGDDLLSLERFGSMRKATCFPDHKMLQNLCWPLIDFPTYSRSKGHVLSPAPLPGRGFFVSGPFLLRESLFAWVRFSQRPSKGLLVNHGTPVALHRRIVGGDQLRRHHALQLVVRTDTDQGSEGGANLLVSRLRMGMLPKRLHGLEGKLFQSSEREPPIFLSVRLQVGSIVGNHRRWLVSFAVFFPVTDVSVMSEEPRPGRMQPASVSILAGRWQVLIAPRRQRHRLDLAGRWALGNGAYID